MRQLIRQAEPYQDTEVLDERAPRFNQGTIGVLTIVALLTKQPGLIGLLALQLIIGLFFGRQYCLPCLFYFEIVQPRFGEGPLEDSRAPRFANFIGAAFLGSATLAIYLGETTLGWALAIIVSVLALLAATTGLCVGCEAYRLLARLRGVNTRHFNHIDAADVDYLPIFNGNPTAFVAFSHPLCSECQTWEKKLESQKQSFIVVNVSQNKDLAHKYGVAYVPTVVKINEQGQVLERLAP